MDDGIIDNRRICGWVEDSGYDSSCEAETFSDANCWTKDGGEVLDSCIRRHLTVV